MATTNSAINTSNPISVASGGTGRATLTTHGVLVGATTGAITQLGVGTNGQVLVGSSAADPVFATLTSSTLGFTTGAGTLAINSSPARFQAYVTTTVNNVTGSSVTYNIVCDTKKFDTATAFNTANGAYTVPNTGVYVFGGTYFMGNIIAQTGFETWLTTTGGNYYTSYLIPTSISLAGYYALNWQVIAQMTANDLAYPTINITGSTQTVNMYGTTALTYTGTQFWGYQIA